MSHKVNTIILERAAQLMPELTEAERAVMYRLIKNNDLEGLWWFVKHTESSDKLQLPARLVCGNTSTFVW